MEKSKLHGIEIDPLSGRIAKQLYQKANIAIEGFEETNLPDNHFDVVLGNIPFGEFKVNDSRYNAQKFLIHDYFIAKALDKVRSGGVVMFITSKGTMDKASPEVRKYIARRAELLGAVRLPDNTFRANAGTEVTSDILILQKRDRMMEIEPEWVHLDTDENGVTMNSYFVTDPSGGYKTDRGNQKLAAFPGAESISKRTGLCAGEAGRGDWKNQKRHADHAG